MNGVTRKSAEQQQEEMSNMLRLVEDYITGKEWFVAKKPTWVS